MNNTCMDELTGFWEPGLLLPQGHGCGPQPRVEMPLEAKARSVQPGQVTLLPVNHMAESHGNRKLCYENTASGTPRVRGRSQGRLFLEGPRMVPRGHLSQRRVSAGRPPRHLPAPGSRSPRPAHRRSPPPCPPRCQCNLHAQRCPRA